MREDSHAKYRRVHDSAISLSTDNARHTFLMELLSRGIVIPFCWGMADPAQRFCIAFRMERHDSRHESFESGVPKLRDHLCCSSELADFAFCALGTKRLTGAVQRSWPPASTAFREALAVISAPVRHFELSIDDSFLAKGASCETRAVIGDIFRHFDFTVEEVLIANGALYVAFAQVRFWLAAIPHVLGLGTRLSATTASDILSHFARQVCFYERDKSFYHGWKNFSVFPNLSKCKGTPCIFSKGFPNHVYVF